MLFAEQLLPRIIRSRKSHSRKARSWLSGMTRLLSLNYLVMIQQPPRYTIFPYSTLFRYVRWFIDKRCVIPESGERFLRAACPGSILLLISSFPIDVNFKLSKYKKSHKALNNAALIG